MKTDQEIFDEVVRHLHAQGGPSYDPSMEEEGLYHGSDGRKDPVGLFIPANLYHEGLEGKTVGAKEVLAALPKEFRNKLELLEALQSIHDMSQMEKDFTWGPPWGHGGIASGLADTAKLRSLDPAVVHELWKKE
jgi:hypothetical protein